VAGQLALAETRTKITGHKERAILTLAKSLSLKSNSPQHVCETRVGLQAIEVSVRAGWEPQ
jgi:hypothetical protein